MTHEVEESHSIFASRSRRRRFQKMGSLNAHSGFHFHQTQDLQSISILGTENEDTVVFDNLELPSVRVSFKSQGDAKDILRIIQEAGEFHLVGIQFVGPFDGCDVAVTLCWRRCFNQNDRL